MTTLEIVCFLMILLNVVFSLINLVVLDAALQEFEKRLKEDKTHEWKP